MSNPPHVLSEALLNLVGVVRHPQVPEGKSGVAEDSDSIYGVYVPFELCYQMRTLSTFWIVLELQPTRTPAVARAKPSTGRDRQSGVFRMVRWNFDIPPDAVHDFVADMRAYHAEEDGHRRDQIAARQARLLNDHLKSKRMTASEVGEVFILMKDGC
jgi:hypothetical protein